MIGIEGYVLLNQLMELVPEEMCSYRFGIIASILSIALDGHSVTESQVKLFCSNR